MTEKSLKPSVSIILPTYNRAWSLPQCLKSVFDQTYLNFELIVVDDGSTDDTKEIIDGFIAMHGMKVKYIYQEHVNTAAARNRGLAVAEGHYIAFIDSDDQWIPEKLEKQVQYLESNDVDMVHTAKQVEYLTPDLSDQLMPMPHKLARNSKDYLGGKTYISMTTLGKRSAHKIIGGFNEGFDTTEDVEYWIRFSKKFKIGLIDEPLTVVHKHDTNQSTVNLELKYSDRVRIYESLVEDSHPWIDRHFWGIRLGMTYFGLALEKMKKGKVHEHDILMEKSAQWDFADINDELQRGGMVFK